MSAQPERYCPHCGVAYEPTQEYCLECGTRLPTNQGVVGVLAGAWQRRFAWYPGDWIWPTLFLLVLAVGATAVAVAANAARKSSKAHTIAATLPSISVGPGVAPTNLPVSTTPNTLVTPTNHPTITTGPLPAAPGSGTGARPTKPTTNPNALATWPANKSGYTLVLESLPVADGRAAAVARARRAKANGLENVGVLVSSQYASLHPGYFVIFSGIYGSASEAAAAVASAHSHGFPDAYQTRVTR